MRIVARATYGKARIEAGLRAAAGADIAMAEDDAALARLAPEAEALVLPGPSYTAAVAEAARSATRLRWIQVLTAGYEPLQQRGVPEGVTVSNAGEAWSPGVAEHALTLLFALVKRVPDILANHARRGWERGFSGAMGSLDGMTLAILGYGSIGRAVAARARPFGIRVIGLRRHPAPDPDAAAVRPVAELHAVLAEADACLVAAPLSPETRGLLGAAAFAVCKPGMLVVNVSRGGIVDPHALAEALASGRLGGAALDVTDPEPLPPDHPLWQAPGLIVSPHVAGACGPRGEERLAALVADNLARVLAGEPPRHVVRV